MSVICSPHEYYASKFQGHIENLNKSNQSRWIFDIIDNHFMANDEVVFLNNQEWCLCLDKHYNEDIRYLVVFKDLKLKTVRDLRAEHVRMLCDVQEQVSEWIYHKHKTRYCMYFHYMPSVFQLHLHVNFTISPPNVCRAHTLQSVLRNLRLDTFYYKEALLLTRVCKTIRRAETHNILRVSI